MATPDIGTTISEGYGRGLDRIGPVMAAVAVPAIVVGAVYALQSVVQANVLEDSVEDAITAAFSGGSIGDGLSFGDRLVLGAVAIIASVVNVFVTTGATAVVAGAFHRERHGGAFELPGPGGSMGAVIEQVKLLQPRLTLLALLGIAGTAVGILNSILGGLVGLVAGIALIVVSVRWIYAPVMSGSGEASGIEAYERSEQVVEGSWWGTLGVWIVVALAIALPAAIAGAIVGVVLASILGLLGAFATYTIIMLALSSLFASALESAWAQVEGGDAGGDAQPPSGELPATPPVEPTPPTEPPASNGPFV